AADIVGGFVVPVDHVDMETEDSAPDTPQETSTEDDTADTQPPYTIVGKRQKYLAMIEACALPNCAMAKLSDAIQRHLRTLATVIGSAELVHLPNGDANGTVVPFVVFEVLSEQQLLAISRSGITINMGLEDVPTKFLYRQYTAAHQEQHVSRQVMLKAMAFNTTIDDIKVAMIKWGPVSYVKLGYNSKKSMRIATVTFTQPDAVTAMATAGTTCLAVGRTGDVACVAKVGSKVIPIKSSMTKKLINLPPYFKPIDVLKIFETIPTELGVFPCQGITMPLDVRTKRRQPHAFVYFDNEEQWARVSPLIFAIETYRTAWVDVDTVLCCVCSSEAHRQADCPIQQKRDILLHIRKVNTLNINTNSNKATATSDQTTTSPVKTATPQAIKTQHSKAYSPSNATKSASYSKALTGKGENTVVKCAPSEQLMNAATSGHITYPTGNGMGKENATTPTAGPSRSFEELMSASAAMRRRVADLVQQCEMDKQKWNAFQLRFEQMNTRMAGRALPVFSVGHADEGSNSHAGLRG
ncbi:hypothetical protein BGZ72_010544, partial [Mortierella alpina]